MKAAASPVRRWVRGLAWGLGLLLAVLVIVAVIGLALAQRKAQRRLQIPVAALALPVAEAGVIERGRYLFESRGCADCHGANAGGRHFVDAGPVQMVGPGITGSARSAEDWVRAVRHGVAADGRPLRIMPAEDYNRLTDADLGALVSYVRSLPAQPGLAARVDLPLPARVAYGLGLADDAADRIDHSLPVEQAVPEGLTVAHGRYVAQMCIACHGAGFAGGRIPGAPPDWPASANLTPGQGGVMGRYPDLAAFAKMMRSGLRPDGSRVAVMPFEALAKITDTDLEAMRLYLASLPPKAAGTR